MAEKFDAALPFGAYETAVTRRVLERLAATQSSDSYARFAIEDVTPELEDRFIDAIAHSISEHLVQKLGRAKNASERIELINALAHLIDPDDVVETEQLLHAVYQSSVGTPPKIPAASITPAALLTNAEKEASMSHEIKREILTADSVDLLLAFVKDSGISAIRKPLEHLREYKIPLRVITSTYLGATSYKAINRLVNEFNAQVKIGYETNATRLHAKAWLFRRNSGFDTAYIGSSNLSSSALIDGIEWNVRATRTATPGVVKKFEAVFETYWNDPQYVDYDPSTDLEHLKTSLKKAKFAGTSQEQIQLSGLRVEPYPYQQSILEALATERELHDRHRNLVIAATGTGKTVVAALDYREIADKLGRKPRLLFVAHRKELLLQAQRTYREVLGIADFGELLDGENKHEKGDYLFATIQTLSRTLADFRPDHFEVIVIDEFHHAEAKTYQEVLDHFTPTELLGLTATPERGDGTNVQKFFDYRVAYELRLWDALHQGLLAPMHYYGINDETDLSKVRWSRNSKAYDVSELTNLYVERGDKRVQLILSEMEKRLFDLDEVKALGFCVSIKHAEFMAQRFTAMGMPSAVVSSKSRPEHRDGSIDALRAGEIKVLFTVDLFNEGVDIPEVNTLLLLRPTDSPVIFLQQLGRGLRKRPGKVCTVLDFIGAQHENFDFEKRYGALTGKRGNRLAKEVERDFADLPPGTHMELDGVTQQRVLKNIKRAAKNSVVRLRTLLQQEATTDLSRFLANTNVELEEIYRSRDLGGWTRLLRSVRLLPEVEESELETFLFSRIRAMLHVNDEKRARAYLTICDPDGPPIDSLSEEDQVFARMLVTHIWANQTGAQAPSTLHEAVNMMRSVRSFAEELRQVFTYRLDESRILPEPVEGPGAGVLFTHADYSVGELTAALRTDELPKLLHLPREGVHYVKDANVDLFFVTLVKDEKGFSNTTSYEDYPISRDLFQWESQSTTTLSSRAGQRYIHHEQMGTSIYLCVRNTRQNANKVANAYTLLGNVTHVSHQGEKPIRFQWRLQRQMPAKLYEQGRAVV